MLEIINLRFSSLSHLQRQALLLFTDLILIYFSFYITLGPALFSYINFETLNYFSVSSLWLLHSPMTIALPLFIFTGQYKSLTKYINGSLIYKIGIRTFIYIFIIYLWQIISKNSLIELRSLLILWISLTGSMGIVRLTLRDLLLKINNLSKIKIKVAIYGAGAAGTQLAASLGLSSKHKILAFIDDDLKLQGRYIYGIPVISSDVLENRPYEYDQIFLALPSVGQKRRLEIIRKLQFINIKVFEIPSLDDITSGRTQIDNLRPISIESLLGRNSIVPDKSLLSASINKQVICVTGAGGSIGSELCRQILYNKPSKLILLERSEPSLYLLYQELNNNLTEEIEIKPVLGSTTDFNFITNLFKQEKIDCVFHAAAYKHVPLVELNTLQGVYNNVISTRVICRAALENSLSQMILISTDKAVRPTNVMGASKRLSEIIVQAFSEYSLENKVKTRKTRFSMVRFGNVLGSSGSVVPLFTKQIAEGGPVTVTHPEVIRYFMTIKEAVNLVLQSSTLAIGGDLFLLDMGEPVKIIDLARQMIMLSGLTIKNPSTGEGDIEILVTGLRPGEKLFEELLINAKSETTQHPLIFKAREKYIPRELLFPKLDAIELHIKNQDKEKMFLTLHELVPEWERQ